MNQIFQYPINEKLSEAVLFILKNTKASNIGRKKLAKLLYFADFKHYKKTYNSITGEQYSRWEYGPFPKKLYPTLDYLKAKGQIKIEDVKYAEEKIGKNMTILKTFEPTHLSQEEQDDILSILAKLGSFTGKQLEDLSHDDTPWQVTGEQNIIDYDLVFYRDEETIEQVE
ncbi:MAG: Panacea domain-containing protein [Candidatus Woesearchaeota archaeon]